MLLEHGNFSFYSHTENPLSPFGAPKCCMSLAYRRLGILLTHTVLPTACNRSGAKDCKIPGGLLKLPFMTSLRSDTGCCQEKHPAYDSKFYVSTGKT